MEACEARVLFFTPSVADVNPVNNSTNVDRNVFIGCDVNLSGVGVEVDANTLAGHVTLARTSDGVAVTGTVKTSGGGDSIVFTPLSILQANIQYTFTVTSSVKDTAGEAFATFTSHFTTGSGSGTAPSNIRFDQIALPNATGHQYTQVLVGPDGRLYAADDQGFIYRYDINPDGTLGAMLTINTVRNANGGARLIAGMAFDPHSTAKSPVLWISSGFASVLNSPDLSGKVSRLSGPDLSKYQDEVTNLPRSFKDHLTEGVSFGPDGALYISQASMSAMGAADQTWGNRSEHLLSAAILRLDISKITDVINAKTPDAGGTYNPFAKTAPLRIYADGVRNSYDPVWTDDGFLFAPTNGSSAGGNSPPGTAPFGGTRIDSATNGAYTGPAVPGETNLPTQDDYLYNIVAGGYYGHPNPLRDEFVENGGNPTSGIDKAEVTNYPVGTQPDRNYRGFIWDFGNHESPDGAIEYKGNAFGGALNGDLLITQYAGGSNVVDLSRNGATITNSIQNIAGLTGFNEPLGVAENNATGNLYVAQYGGKALTLLRVNESPLASTPAISATATQLLFNAAKGTTSATNVATVLDNGAQDLSITSYTLGGTNASDFKITLKPSTPTSLGPGQSANISLQFVPPSGATPGIETATLIVKSNDPNHPSFSIPLRGLVTAGTNGTSEPSLQRVLDLYQIPVNVGDDDPTTDTLPVPAQQPNDEIVAPTFVRANASQPVSINMLATFDNNFDPVGTVGYYTTAGGAQQDLFSVNMNSSQQVNSKITGVTTFFPGVNPFGLYVDSVQYGHTTYSQDLKNSWDLSSIMAGHLIRVYPMKTLTGVTVANSYLVAVETGSGQPDNQDFVFQISNVKPAPASSSAAPEPPTKLHVTSSAGQVGLAWTASKSNNVVGYIVKRSTNGKTNFIQVNTGIVVGTSFTDTGVGKKRYYYEVFAESDAGALSATAPRVIVDVGAASSTPAPTPAPSSINLTSLDIGSPTPGGSTSVLVDGASYDVLAGGSDIQGTSDQFRFAYTELTGNFDMKVRVNTLSEADVWSKAGIMVRKTLDANARNIYVLSSPTKYRMTYRVNPGDTTTAVGVGTPNFPDNWLRLQRVGNTYTGYFSTDGVTWSVISSVTMNLGKTLFVGLATTSHNPSETTTAQYRQLTV
jgi:glucose/arabinose dehydrogenase